MAEATAKTPRRQDEEAEKWFFLGVLASWRFFPYVAATNLKSWPGNGRYHVIARAVLMRILLVEDNDNLRRALHRLLEDVGADQIAEACDGQEAMSRMPDVRPDLIVTDFQMPQMDGIRFTRAIRAAGIATPIVMISAMNDPTVTKLALDAGVNQFLSKADETDALRATFRKIVGEISKAA
jgi:CheY-like chemotaxis protein